MNKKFGLIISFLVFSFLSSLPTFAFNSNISGTLEGSVVDNDTGQPLIGVNIIIMKTKLGGTTNDKGTFRILNIPAGNYSVQFSYIGYKKTTVEDVIIHVNETSRLEVKLEPGDLALDEIIVAAEQLPLKQDVTGTTFIVPQKYFARLPVDNFEGIVASFPGVTRDLHIRGGRKTEVLYLVDGLSYTEAGGATIGGQIPKSAIMEMKIQTGGFEAEYGNALSGVINIVTKRGSDVKEVFSRVHVDHYFNTEETSRTNEFEFSLGGPTKWDDLVYFTAADFRTSYTRWQEDFSLFFDDPVEKGFNSISRLDYNYGDNTRFNLQLIASWQKQREYEFRWRRNLTGLPESEKTTYRISAGMSQFLSDNTFYNVNVSRFHVNTHLGPEKREELENEGLFEYDFFLRYVTDGTRKWWADENQTQWTFNADLTSVYQDAHTFKIGGEITTYTMDIERLKIEPQTTFYGKPLVAEEPLDFSTNYLYRPMSGSVFIQNKFRFVDDGTFSAGVRWDFLDPKASRPNLEWVPEGDEGFKQVINEWVPASFKQNFSPRFGLTIPLSEGDFFFVNFGVFYQFPLFDLLFSGLDINLKKKQNLLIGNPDLRPQKTTAWEFSYRRQIPLGMTVNATIFNKETTNLIDTNTFIASDSKALDDGYFSQYVNNPYGKTTGFEFNLERKAAGLISGRLSYTFMTTEGLSERFDQELNYLQWGFEPFLEVFPLSWDQRHTFDGVFLSDLPMDFTLDVIANYHSPRPYTFFPSRDGIAPPGTNIQPNNKRMENNLYIDVKATKTFTFNRGSSSAWSLLVYMDVRNLFDKKNVLWIASDGIIGGELRDPGAFDTPRRTRLGLEFSF